ncbi:MAG: hypothetical protein AB8H79_09460 [Myxococcota bacterium]
MLLCTFLAGCGGADPVPASVPVLDAFAELHPRVYQVYDLPLDRDEVWSLLDRSFSGEALTEQYVEHWTTRMRMEAEETAIRIARVDHDKVELVEESPGFARVDVAWSVGGVVPHKDHKHPRVNRYRAVYALAAIDGQWKIVNTRMRDVQRVRSPSRTDGVFDILDESAEQGGGYLDPLDLLDAGVGDDTDTDAVEGEF